jgi:hypothetical protein
MMWLKGDRVKTIQEPYITGIVVEDHGNTVVIEDDHAETDDSRLEFHKSELEVFKGGRYHPVEGNTWKDVIGY